MLIDSLSCVDTDTRVRDSLPPRISSLWRTRKVSGAVHFRSSLFSWREFSGKTSLIHSLAGELGLDIYVVSLSAKGYVPAMSCSSSAT